ncbi:RimJ/RimL family protein N-acetyltransferase [Kribbella sp. VKM Ac-2527]|uniref:RimJ/RimL family protein N-acetyltransferase n=1 Tax=Kribbella caucasensis TaxID=2512215 RepID=A0A4R6K9Y6_9ACTN|nr:GNAT family N-acetyltransferase [Kribbella sp. VKM Ac-2527]TDO45388.1 RimJ/RimL family protein N-acetyltransferase [Kribbella sp. VKM Ac-2527]
MRTTDRLVLRPFRDSDLEPWVAMNTDPEVMKYLGGKPLSPEESERITVGVNKRYESDGIGFLAIERRSDGAFLGACGLQHEPWYPDDMELGWRLAREYWGHGYATEAASSWMAYGFTELDLPRIISITDTPNERSIAVMRRLGMSFDHAAELEEDGDTFEAVIYSITPEAWRIAQ